MRQFRNARHPGRSGSRAFTLVELLVVVGIIALLVTILMPSLGRALELARRVKCQTNLHSLGMAWHLYWADNNHKFPGVNHSNNNEDMISMSSLYIMLNNKIVNTGYLWQSKLVSSEDVFICPSTDKSTRDPWFDDRHGAYPPWRSPNPWPPDTRGYRHCRSTYMTRRMDYYNKADVIHSNTSSNRPYMLRRLGMNALRDPGSFSFMGDNFNGAYATRMSHYPGICVIYADGHGEYFQDDTDDGSILHEANGLAGANHSTNYNFAVDRVWMVIDGRMEPLGTTYK